MCVRIYVCACRCLYIKCMCVIGFHNYLAEFLTSEGIQSGIANSLESYANMCARMDQFLSKGFLSKLWSFDQILRGQELLWREWMLWLQHVLCQASGFCMHIPSFSHRRCSTERRKARIVLAVTQPSPHTEWSCGRPAWLAVARLAPSCPSSSFRKSGEMGREELLTGFPKGPFDPKEAKKLPMFSYYLLTFEGRFIFSPNLFSVIQARGEFHFPHTHFLNIKFHFIKLQLFKKKTLYIY